MNPAEASPPSEINYLMRRGLLKIHPSSAALIDLFMYPHPRLPLSLTQFISSRPRVQTHPLLSWFVSTNLETKIKSGTETLLLRLRRWWRHRVMVKWSGGGGGGGGKRDWTAPTWCILGMCSSGGQQGPYGVFDGRAPLPLGAPLTTGEVQRNICCQRKPCGKNGALKITSSSEERREVNSIRWLHRGELQLEELLRGSEIQTLVCTLTFNLFCDSRSP